MGLVFSEPTYKPPRNTSFIHLMGLILKQSLFKNFEKYPFYRFNIKWFGNISWIQIHSQKMMMDDTNIKPIILNTKKFKKKKERKLLWYQSEGKTLWRKHVLDFLK